MARKITKKSGRKKRKPVADTKLAMPQDYSDGPYDIYRIKTYTVFSTIGGINSRTVIHAKSMLEAVIEAEKVLAVDSGSIFMFRGDVRPCFAGVDTGYADEEYIDWSKI